MQSLTYSRRPIYIGEICFGSNPYLLVVSFKILVYILNLICRKAFNFLSVGHQEKTKYHLVNWQSLARPNICGGWGIKNNHWFGEALSAKSLWRAIFGSMLWHQVISSKYLRD